jgi:anaerobic selenocysteine-containing dehydrogenase
VRRSSLIVAPTSLGGTEVGRHRTFCRLCQANCGLVVTVDGDVVTRVDGDRDDPLSRGYSCEKGRAVGRLHHDPTRLLTPRLRGAAAGWQELLEDLGATLARVRADHGPDAIAIYNGTGAAFDAAGRLGQLALLAAVGTRSRYTPITIDCPSKPLVAELVGGNMGLVPVPDYHRARLLLYVGSNPIVSHGSFHGLCDPVRHLCDGRSRGEVWVLDVRRTETARLATRHLAPRPGTDAAVLAHVVRELLLDGAARTHIDAHTAGVDDLRTAVQRFDASTTATMTGLEIGDLVALVNAVRRAGRVCVQTGTGTSMGPGANVVEHLAWALQVVTDSFEQPGGQWFNPGFLSPPDAPHRAFPPATGAEAGPTSRPELPRRFNQLPCAALADEIECGNVRALLVFGGNPLVAFPEPDRLRRAFGRLDALAVWDIVETPTVACATHVLPALDSLERADVNLTTGVVASELVGRYTPPLAPPAGDQRATWWSVAGLARRMGLEIGIDPDTSSEDSVLAGVLSASRVPADELREAGVVVIPGIDHPWVDAVLPDGRWQLAPPELLQQLRMWEPPAPGIVLTPRRERGHVNSTMATGTPTAELHPVDADALGIQDGQTVRVRSSVGSVDVTVRVHEGIGPGAIAVPHGYADSPANRLIASTGLDPLTGMVLQSGLAVQVEVVGDPA